MSLFIRKVFFPIIAFSAVLILIIYFINDHQKVDDSVDYILKSHKNTVALYKNGELIKTYDDIVLNTLPTKDILSFNNGISVTTPSQAEKFLEDFE